MNVAVFYGTYRNTALAWRLLHACNSHRRCFGVGFVFVFRRPHGLRLGLGDARCKEVSRAGDKRGG